jgi:predicted nuclease of predicted toxin-antitoxin system
MNLSRELGRLLESQGHTWRHARDAGLAEAADSAIVEIAKANGEVILTHDLDYGHLLAFSGFDAPRWSSFGGETHYLPLCSMR